VVMTDADMDEGDVDEDAEGADDADEGPEPQQDDAARVFLEHNGAAPEGGALYAGLPPD
jgi:hypothetical protein